MTWSWFDLAWPWIGSVAAAIFLIFLFGTDKLRGNLQLRRWRDPVWLSWVPVPIYMLHNVEEYGIDLRGNRHYFPDTLCTTVGLAPYPACAVPPVFFLAVNISLIWIAAPVAALLGRKHPLVGFAFYGVVITNGFTHIVPMIFGNGYNPGAFTAIILFVPLFFWALHTRFGPGRISYKGIAVIIAAGVIVHVVLMASLLAFIHGVIGAGNLVLLQIINAGLLLLIPWLSERLLGLTPMRHPQAAAAVS